MFLIKKEKKFRNKVLRNSPFFPAKPKARKPTKRKHLKKRIITYRTGIDKIFVHLFVYIYIYIEVRNL